MYSIVAGKYPSAKLENCQNKKAKVFSIQKIINKSSKGNKYQSQRNEDQASKYYSSI